MTTDNRALIEPDAASASDKLRIIADYLYLDMDDKKHGFTGTDAQQFLRALAQIMTIDKADWSRGGNSHYAVVTFSGDPASEHPDDELRGIGPSLSLIACGPEDFCWRSIAAWTEHHSLRMWEQVEVLARHPSLVRPGSEVSL